MPTLKVFEEIAPKLVGRVEWYLLKKYISALGMIVNSSTIIVHLEGIIN